MPSIRTTTHERALLEDLNHAVPDHDTLDTLVWQKLRVVLDDRRFLPKGGTLAFPCSHLYHQDARFQRKPRPFSCQTVSITRKRNGENHQV